MAKYENDVKQLLTLIGGKENIQAVSHCMTRMRFVLVDPKKADEKAIEEIPSVKGTFTQAGQYQVIIGNDVSVFYNEFTSYAGIEGVSKDAAKAAAKTNQNLAQKIMGALGEIFAPLIPALICGGLILGFRNVIGEINFFNNGKQSLADLYPFWQGTYDFLWLIGEAVFHLLPVGIVWSITKKMGTTQILGIILGLTLVSPQLLNGFSVADTPASEIPVWDFGFAQVDMIGYQGQVIAAMMAGFVLVYLEKFFKKHCPEVVSMIVVPFCSLVPAVIIAHTVVGPIGWKIGDAIASVVYGGLMSDFGWLFAGVFGLLYAPVVMTGLHHMTNAIDTQLVNTYDGTILWPMIALSNIAQGSSVLAMSILQKKNERAQQVNIPACISCYLGVTEPALFGVNLKYVFPLICGMIGSAIAAMISVGSGVMALSIGVGGLPGIISIKPEFYVQFLIAMAVAIVVPFTLTFIVGSRKLSAKERGTAKSESKTEVKAEKIETEQIETENTETEKGVKAILSGKVIPIEEVDDNVFSQKIMGDGVAIEPTDTTVVAPSDAEVAIVMADTGHACGLTLGNGMELLIHVGIDTVDMGGDGFELLVSQGDKVSAGTPLIRFDPEKIRAAGHPTTTMLIVTGEGSAKNIKMKAGMTAEAAKTTVISFE
ncbi:MULTISPECIES: PTS system trehalose-specific EIIBC component [Sellimonas]|uniref:PTS trehalose transporter subunit IIBC n=1 Tax=Sellimonas caecigallum TaxID=2592333 RepID=A0ABS7L8D6_9FIRM|nr:MULTISPECIES: PTS system trehalose-specific EIIBC component [Sellimonas]MBY0759134.1 PTS trehalose transporter subunit IIBC [Sellimonas caecigallum]OUP01020.1 PTS trehalose transporter subunit IIBC [Drancourtella sp. An210]OUP66566.1 PTS trehalose transporter subunit IIBC [Drancourtella sp. An177]